MAPTRCGWCDDHPAYQNYHDQEWGVPLHDDQRLFEMLILEGAQAGLSWLTILKKREQYRQAFDQFDAERIASYDQRKIQELLANPGIVRNRLKVQSVPRNARGFLQIQQDFGSFDTFVWGYVDGRPRQNAWPDLEAMPAQTPESQAMSRELNRRGFNFVGPTICYAFMQAVGMVNDHTTDCFRHRELALRPYDNPMVGVLGRNG